MVTVPSLPYVTPAAEMSILAGAVATWRAAIGGAARVVTLGDVARVEQSISGIGPVDREGGRAVDKQGGKRRTAVHGQGYRAGGRGHARASR